MKAVILAAGSGSRIDFNHNKPKGFIELQPGMPLIKRSVEQLLSVGISEVIIVTGYMHHYYHTFFKDHPKVITIHNEHFQRSETLISLATAQQKINDTFLLLEADLIYETRALTSLLSIEKANVLLVSGISNPVDNVFVAVDATNHLLWLKKKITQEIEEQIFGEFVGISKVSYALFSELVKLAESKEGSRLSYDSDGFCQLKNKHPIYCALIKDLLWSEIDCLEHFNWAKRLIADNPNTFSI